MLSPGNNNRQQCIQPRVSPTFIQGPSSQASSVRRFKLMLTNLNLQENLSGSEKLPQLLEAGIGIVIHLFSRLSP